jgi:proteasome lid subunit RPN8/RPN11
MVFGDIRYREPHRLRRPDRDRKWACLAYEVPATGDLPVFLDRLAADAIERHALRDTSVELGGILLGKECVDDQTGAPFVWVTNCLEAKHYENTQASFTYTHDSWEEITRERDRLHPDLDIVGWYHTHPDFGIFLSGHDLFIQQHFFGQPLQVAYVVDPIRQTRGFFQWRNGQMHQVGGYHLIADRADRVALARLANDLENIPTAGDSGGGGLSPRLEAELIAMLTRPSTQYASTAVDRTTTAVLFAMLGAMLGVVGLAAVLWLGQLNTRVNEQTKALDEMQKTLIETSDRQRIALDAAVGDAGDDEPNRFVARYAKVARERDEARRQYVNQITVNDTLAAKSKDQATRLAELKTNLDDVGKRADLNEKDAKETATLRSAFADLKVDYDKQSRKLEELVELTDTPEGRKIADLFHKYNTTWYVAAGGWALSALLALGSLAGYALLRLPVEEPLPPPAQPEGPAHRIV